MLVQAQNVRVRLLQLPLDAGPAVLEPGRLHDLRETDTGEGPQEDLERKTWLRPESKAKELASW